MILEEAKNYQNKFKSNINIIKRGRHRSENNKVHLKILKCLAKHVKT